MNDSAHTFQSPAPDLLVLEIADHPINRGITFLDSRRATTQPADEMSRRRELPGDVAPDKPARPGDKHRPLRWIGITPGIRRERQRAGGLGASDRAVIVRPDVAMWGRVAIDKET